MARTHLRHIKPTVIGVYQAFAEIDDLLHRLEAEGAILVDQDDIPVFRAGDGQWYRTGPAFDGWLDFWRLLQQRMRRTLPIMPIEAVFVRLRDGGQVQARELADARRAVDELRAIYRGLSVTLIGDVRDSGLIRNELDRQAA